MRGRRHTDCTSVWRSARTDIESYHAQWLRLDTLAHTHAEYQVLWTLGGAGRYRYRGAWQETGPGAFLIFHPGEAHALVPLGHWEFLALHVPPDLFVDDLAEPDAAPVFLESPSRLDPALTAAFLALHRCLRAPATPAAEDDSVSRFVDALMPWRVGVANDDGAARPDGVIDAVRKHLEERLGENVSLSVLASRFGMSPAGLCRRFARRVGISPHAYHLQMRLGEAKRLLRSGEAPTEVAAATGFSDQSHLTRYFTRLTGVPPALYARRVKNVQDGSRAAG
jgi:AraC-like DNA-binding protein